MFVAVATALGMGFYVSFWLMSLGAITRRDRGMPDALSWGLVIAGGLGFIVCIVLTIRVLAALLGLL